MRNKNSYTGIILAGGQSLRMGTDKALLTLKNKTFVQIIFEKLKPFCREIIISTNNPEIDIAGARIIPDKIKNIGPAGGLYSAVSESKNQKNIIVTVDTPFITKNVFEFLIKNDSEQFDVLIISEGNNLHPLTGIYDKNFLEVLLQEIEQNNLKLRNIIKKTKFKISDIGNEVFYDKNILKNINTKSDYESVIPKNS